MTQHDWSDFLTHRDLSNDRYLSVDRVNHFLYRLAIGRYVFWGSFDNIWYYQREEDAIIAMQTWNPDVEAEPSGWFRHPDTGRRRTNGDPAQEYIQW